MVRPHTLVAQVLRERERERERAYIILDIFGEFQKALRTYLM